MALVQCPECKREISDQATSCPQCGAPIKVSSPPAPASGSSGGAGSTWTTKRKIPTPVLAVFVLLGGYLAFRLYRPQLESAGVLPAPRWIVDNARGDEQCSVLGEYCLRVRCAITNAGNAAGIAQVAADLTEDGKVVATHRGTRTLAPGQQDTLVLDFPEAQMSAKEHQYRCYPLP